MSLGFVAYLAIGCLIVYFSSKLKEVEELLASKKSEEVLVITVIFVLTYPIWILYGIASILKTPKK